MAGSKFYGLKNKGKKRNKTESDLPSTIEVNEELVEEQMSAPELSEAEVEHLFKSLNEEPTPKKAETVKVVETVIKSEEPKNSDELFVAYGLCYSEEDKKFVKIEVDYNPKTGYSKLRSIEHYADSAPTALNKLNRILSLKLLKREEKY